MSDERAARMLRVVADKLASAKRRRDLQNNRVRTSAPRAATEAAMELSILEHAENEVAFLEMVRDHVAAKQEEP